MPIQRQSRLSHIAALLAVSNYGLWTYMNEDKIIGRPENWRPSIQHEICSVAGFLFESDEHEEMFTEEAEGWYEQIKDLSDDDIRKRFSYNDWVAKVMDAEA